MVLLFKFIVYFRIFNLNEQFTKVDIIFSSFLCKTSHLRIITKSAIMK